MLTLCLLLLRCVWLWLYYYINWLILRYPNWFCWWKMLCNPYRICYYYMIKEVDNRTWSATKTQDPAPCFCLVWRTQADGGSSQWTERDNFRMRFRLSEIERPGEELGSIFTLSVLGGWRGGGWNVVWVVYVYVYMVSSWQVRLVVVGLMKSLNLPISW